MANKITFFYEKNIFDSLIRFVNILRATGDSDFLRCLGKKPSDYDIYNIATVMTAPFSSNASINRAFGYLSEHHLESAVPSDSLPYEMPKIV